jgi:hypothetical protein
LQEAHETATRGRALRERVVEQEQVRELYLAAILSPEEVIVAKE